MSLPVWPSHRVTLQHTHVSTTNGYWSSSILNYHLTQSGHNGSMDHSACSFTSPLFSPPASISPPLSHFSLLHSLPPSFTLLLPSSLLHSFTPFLPPSLFYSLFHSLPLSLPPFLPPSLLPSSLFHSHKLTYAGG